jgi:predicted signal transduction protein with EAL and GGDEF domain
VLIEATIRVAQTLGMTTVAEGIETPAQAALMQRLRCDRGQGFLFAKPLTADELAAWALRPRARVVPATGVSVATLAAPASAAMAAHHPLDFADTDTPDISLQHA